MEVNIILTQLSFAVSTLIGIFISYILPLRMLTRKLNEETQDSNKKHKHEHLKSERLLSYCNCLAAGIFLSLCFIGLIPMVREQFTEFFIAANINSRDYPFAEFSILFGFFVILFMEQLIVIFRRTSHTPILHLDELHSEDEFDDDYEQTSYLLVNGEDNFTNSSDSSTVIVKAVKEGGEEENTESHNKENTLTSVNLNDDKTKRKQRKQIANKGSNEHAHSHGHSHDVDRSKSGFAFFFLVFSTSAHSVFEGLALGLIKDTTKATHLFIGIILHEILVAIALGLNAAKYNYTMSNNIKFGLIFSSTVPFGIILGLLLGNTPGMIGLLISAIFQGIAAGTFLNVAFCDLIPSELFTHNHSKRDNKLMKIFVIFIGYILMASLSFFTGP